MKKYTSIFFVALLAISFLACSSDDDDDNTEVDELVGTWISEGAGQVASGLAAAPFRTKRITATFNENNTYLVVSVDSTDAAVSFTGTWQTGLEAQGEIRSIVLEQTTPTSLTSTGIFQVEGNTLTYEVLQTSPALDGFSAPTVAGGFGSTSYLTYPLGQTWVQRYVRAAN